MSVVVGRVWGGEKDVGCWGGIRRGWQRCCKWLEGIIERAGPGGEHGRIWYSYLALSILKEVV